MHKANDGLSGWAVAAWTDTELWLFDEPFCYSAIIQRHDNLHFSGSSSGYNVKTLNSFTVNTICKKNKK